MRMIVSDLCSLNFQITCSIFHYPLSVLNSDLHNRDIGLHAFKFGLKMYYKNVLSNIYNCDDLRTWKSVCVKCKRARSLDGVISCAVSCLLHRL